MAASSEPFDIVISFDTTASMYACLENVKGNMRSMIRQLRSKIPDVQIGVIAHGDYDTDLYVIKYEDLTSNADRLCSFVSAAGCNRGCTWDECYELALRYSRTKLSWRENSSRALIMVGDCRPHEVNDDQNNGQIDWETEIIKLRDMSSSKPTLLLDTCQRKSVPDISLSSELHNSSEDQTEDSDEEQDQEGMVCQMCKIGKPPNEFPSSNLSEECEHGPLECLRCVVKHVHETGRCPGIGCDVKIDPAGKMVEFLEAKLDRMFMNYSKVYQANAERLKRSGEYICVSSINGDTEMVRFNEKMKIGDLKREIGHKLNLRIEQQRFIYNDTILKSDGTLADYNISSGASISLVLPLYCIPEDLNHVVFDLSWDFPSDIPDFLDASCMAFSKDDFVQFIDWTHPSEDYFLKDSVKHSEKNLAGPGGKTGHQTIHVHLKKIPQNITHLYFTLSSWRSPNLSAFGNPSLKFYEASEENLNLCETTFTHALNSQAVIMCSAVRAGTKWQIFECGAGSLVAGNAKRYNPIRARIAKLIRSEL